MTSLWGPGNWCPPQAQRRPESEIKLPMVPVLRVFSRNGDGRVAALISYDGRKSLSIGGGSLEEQAEAFKTFLAYAGRYTFNGEQVTHHVEVSSIQNYVHRDLVRYVKFQGDQIILVTPPTRINGKIQTVELIWQRLRPASVLLEGSERSHLAPFTHCSFRIPYQ